MANNRVVTKSYEEFAIVWKKMRYHHFQRIIQISILNVQLNHTNEINQKIIPRKKDKNFILPQNVNGG